MHGGMEVEGCDSQPASQPARQAAGPTQFQPRRCTARSMAIVTTDQQTEPSVFFVCLGFFFGFPVPGRRLCPIDTALMAPHHPSINRLENISRSLLAEPSSGYEKNSGGQIRFK